MMRLLLVVLGLISYGSCQLRSGQTDRQRGTFLGHFETLEHEVGGAVWALDDEWLRVEGFTYDGRGPDAFFWVGTEGDQPSPRGFLVPFPSNGSGSREMVLPAFHGSDVLFRLPDKLKVSDLRWISVWCRRFTVNFGSLLVPRNIVLPVKRKISELSRLAHGVRSGNVTLLDAKTLYIPNLHYDGSAPDAFFWVGKGKPDRTGRKIPNEKQSTAVLSHYDGVDIELVLPDNLTLYDIDYLSIWCVSYRHNFGHVMIPAASELFLPPALGQTQAGSELQPVASDPRNQYDVVDQVPDTTERGPTDTGATETTETGATETVMTETETTETTETVDTEGVMTETEATKTETETEATKTETETEAAMTETETEATKTETETEAAMTETETEAAMTETETEAAMTETETEAAMTETETEAAMTETETETESAVTETAMTEPVTEISVSDSESTVTKTESETTQSESGSYDSEEDETEVDVSEAGRMFEDEFPTDPDLHFEDMNTNTTFASNYAVIAPEDLSDLENPNLTTNEYTFKYDQDPEIEPVTFNETNQITEVLIHDNKDEYTFAVGDDDSIQHVVDSFNSGDDFDPYGLVKIEFKKHSGAYFFANPNGTSEHKKPHVHHEEDSHEAQEDAEDLIHQHHHHPKDIYSVKVAVRNDHDDSDDDVVSSAERVSVPGGIYTSFLAVIGLTILMWKM